MQQTESLAKIGSPGLANVRPPWHKGGENSCDMSVSTTEALRSSVPSAPSTPRSIWNPRACQPASVSQRPFNPSTQRPETPTGVQRPLTPSTRLSRDLRAPSPHALAAHGIESPAAAARWSKAMHCEAPGRVAEQWPSVGRLQSHFNDMSDPRWIDLGALKSQHANWQTSQAAHMTQRWSPVHTHTQEAKLANLTDRVGSLMTSPKASSETPEQVQRPEYEQRQVRSREISMSPLPPRSDLAMYGNKAHGATKQKPDSTPPKRTIALDDDAMSVDTTVSQYSSPEPTSRSSSWGEMETSVRGLHGGVRHVLQVLESRAGNSANTTPFPALAGAFLGNFGPSTVAVGTTSFTRLRAKGGKVWAVMQDRSAVVKYAPGSTSANILASGGCPLSPGARRKLSLPESAHNVRAQASCVREERDNSYLENVFETGDAGQDLAMEDDFPCFASEVYC
jgi:hypothetical protein